jgi:hypothetical protein
MRAMRRESTANEQIEPTEYSHFEAVVSNSHILQSRVVAGKRRGEPGDVVGLDAYWYIAQVRGCRGGGQGGTRRDRTASEQRRRAGERCCFGTVIIILKRAGIGCCIIGMVPLPHVALEHLVMLCAAEYAAADTSKSRHGQDLARRLGAGTDGFRF